MKDSNPLVSIIVITYNSEKYVLETLESAKVQTYRNIELIISDDASADNTVDLCRNWLERNKDRFIRTEIVTVPKNTGIPANCNRGIKASRGEWLKLCAGDDVLLEDCIEKNIKFCKDTGAEICFSKMDYIDNIGQPLPRDLQHDAQLERFFSKKFEEKKEAYLRNPLFLNVPTEFFSRELYDRCGGFDERIRLLEDQPFFYRILNAGADLQYFDEVTVLYRKHGGSTVLNTIFIDDLIKSFEFYREEQLNKSLFGRLLASLEKDILKGRKQNKTNDLFLKLKAKILFHLITLTK